MSNQADTARLKPPTNLLRVAVVARREPGVTGTSRYAATLLRELPEAGVAAELACPEDPLVNALNGPGKHIGIDLERFFGQYPRRFPRRDVDVYHLATQTLATLLLRPHLDRPVVVTVHDIIPYLLRADTQFAAYGHAAHRAMDWLAMRGLTHADAIAADSDWTRDTLLRELSVPEHRVRTVRLGVDCDRFRPVTPDEHFWDRYGLAFGQPFILYLGSEDPRKNVASLVRAMAQIKDPELLLVKAGPAHHLREHQSLLRLAQELGIAEKIRWVDHVPEDDLPAFYSAARMFVMPSIWEGFGLPVLEAMACGTRVVCANSSSLPELAGADSIVCDPTPEGLARAIEAGIRGEAQAGAAERLAWAGAFTWRKTAEGTAQLYRDTMDGKL
ncbi:MAG: glycosyltransferase family 4 protein [Chloroflexi bacterium]|nr:glycosyltransferase family 4 protein [Chloroflexota bacterium]